MGFSLVERKKNPPEKKAKTAAPKHKAPTKSTSSSAKKTSTTKQTSATNSVAQTINPVVEQELNELISNLELLKPIKKDWKYRIGEFLGQLILTFIFVVFLSLFIWSISVVPPKSTLLGYPVGGKLPPTVFEQINLAIKDKLNDPIEVQTPQGIYTITPNQVGLEIDLPETINSINKNPFTFLKSSLFPQEIMPKITVDEFLLRNTLNSVALKNTFAPVNATLTTKEGQIITTQAKSGQQVDWEKTVKSIRESWLHEIRKPEVAIAYVLPKVNDEDVLTAIENLAELAVSATISLKFGKRVVEITPQVIGSALNFVEENNKLVSKFDEKVIINEITRQIPNMQAQATDARFDFVGNKVVLIPAQEGIKFTPGQLDAAMSSVFRQKNNRQVNLDSAVIKPAVSTESLEALGIKEQLSTYRQAFDYMPYREINVGQAARYMDGKILKPGEIYSMNETIKERTSANGYVKGIYIAEGGRFDYGLGGGVSIITAATWSAAFYAGLERIEQRAHSVLISRYTPGLEATVSWPRLDLKFKNNTKNHVLIKAIPERDGITISMYGTKEFDKVTAKFGKPYNLNNNIDTVTSYDPNCLAQDPAPGFKINVTRQFWKNNTIVKEEDFLTSYRPSDHIICLQEGQVAPIATPTPTIGGVEQPAPQSEITANS
ncbi:MAG: hypothetical protein RLZZ37_874 [Actinomycetota bacterium]